MCAFVGQCCGLGLRKSETKRKHYTKQQSQTVVMRVRRFSLVAERLLLPSFGKLFGFAPKTWAPFIGFVTVIARNYHLLGEPCGESGEAGNEKEEQMSTLFCYARVEQKVSVTTLGEQLGGKKTRVRVSRLIPMVNAVGVCLVSFVGAKCLSLDRQIASFKSRSRRSRTTEISVTPVPKSKEKPLLASWRDSDADLVVCCR